MKKLAFIVVSAAISAAGFLTSLGSSNVDLSSSSDEQISKQQNQSLVLDKASDNNLLAMNGHSSHVSHRSHSSHYSSRR